jgi:D-galactarolactone isomerase
VATHDQMAKIEPAITIAENLVTLDAIKQAGGNARGVAIINPTISNADLQTLHDGGVCGIRFSSTGGSVPAAIAKEIEPLAKRVADLGWHVQINIEAGPILELEDLWNRLPATLVIDHMGHIRQPQGVEDPAFKYILRLIDKGRTWVKLSITYDSSKDGPPGYADVNKVGRPMSKPPPSAWFGARIGRIRTRPTSQTMPCCSTNSRSGLLRRPSATISWSTIRRPFTDSQEWDDW